MEWKRKLWFCKLLQLPLVEIRPTSKWLLSKLNTKYLQMAPPRAMTITKKAAAQPITEDKVFIRRANNFLGREWLSGSTMHNTILKGLWLGYAPKSWLSCLKVALKIKLWKALPLKVHGLRKELLTEQTREAISISSIISNNLYFSTRSPRLLTHVAQHVRWLRSAPISTSFPLLLCILGSQPGWG